MPVLSCDEVKTKSNSKIPVLKKIKSNGLSFCFEKLFLGLICTIVAIGFCVPVIIYIFGSDPSESEVTIDFEFGNCSTTIVQVSEHSLIYIYTVYLFALYT